MSKKDCKERAANEVDRLKELLFDCQVSKNRIKALTPIIENVSCMKVKLDDLKSEMMDADMVIAYDNGGGQTGERENPIFRGYENLWKSYMAGMSKILDSLPTEKVAVPEVEDLKPQTVLAMVRNKHRSDT